MTWADIVESVVFYMTIPAVLLALIGVILDLLPWQPPGGPAVRLAAQLALVVELVALIITLFLSSALAHVDQRDLAVGVGIAGFALVLFTMGSVAWALVLKRLTYDCLR